MARVKRQAAGIRAAADIGEATKLVARLGEIQRDQALIKAALEEAIAAAKNDAAARHRQLQAEADDLTRQVQLWAEAHRHELTLEGRTKTVRLASGLVCWREQPPRVVLNDVAAVTEELVARGLKQFLRTKLEISKEAMLAEPGIATMVPGVAISRPPEAFVIEPDAVKPVTEVVA